MNTVSVKRKRGRPRRDEPPEINEFDISLIREFANRPAFYDRSCVHYRNRDYLDLQWEQMAQNLGYSVSLIKDRMMQLRNRYNLEKRRVDTLQAQYNDPSIKSQWPLYDYMNFLGDYIKARRPYRYTHNRGALPGPIMKKNNNSNSSSEAYEDEESQNHTSNDTESEHQQPVANNVKFKAQAHSTIDHESQSNNSSRGPTSLPPVQRNECHQQQHKQEPGQSGRAVLSERRQELSAEKYKAFGQFLAASLIEMNELDALQLVNKFTAELVRSMYSDFRTNTGHNNTSDNASDSVEISI